MTGDLIPVPTGSACSGHVDDGQGRCRSCGRFLPGNRYALVHGGQSPTTLADDVAAARSEIEQALADAPGSEPRFRLAREQAASILARVRRMRAHVERVDVFDRKSRVRSVVAALDRAETTLARAIDALGMSPASASRLGVDLARVRSIDIAAELAEGRRLREQAEARRNGDTS